MPYANVNSKCIFYSLVHPVSPSRATSSSPITLLFIHGLGSSSSFYVPLVPHLAALGYVCLAIDTHGSGSSPYTGSGNSIISIASDAGSVLDVLGIAENVVIVGHSMGGIVASYLAAHDPVRRFKAVILIGPVHPNPHAAEVFRNRIGIVEKDGMEPLASSIPITATGSASTPLVHAFIRTLLLTTSTDGYISLCTAIAEAPIPRYSNIKIPLLIIVGSEDKSAPIDNAAYIVDQYGSQMKELRVLEGVGHWHVLEAYSRVQDMICEFLGAVGII